MPKKYLFFDNDGVLVDSEYWYFMANQRALAELDISLTKPRYLKIMAAGENCWQLCDHLKLSQSTIDQHRQHRNQYYQQYLRTEDINIDGVEELLKALSTHYHMAIVTTSRRQDFEIIHKHRGIVEHMDFVLTREDYVNSKPQPDPYLAALKRYGCSADEALVIEDSQRGLGAAVAAGIECAVVFNEFTQSHDLSAASYHIATLQELTLLLKP